MKLYDEFGLNLGGESDLTTAPSSGIGIAPEQIGAPVETRIPKQTKLGAREEMIAGMSPSERFFGMLGDVGRGLQGKPLRIDAMVEEKRKEKLLRMEELKGSVSSLEHGIKLAEGLDGDKRKEFVESYAGRLDEIQPGLGGTYRALAEKPGLLTQFQQYMPYLSQPMQTMLKTNPQGFLKFAGTAEGMKALEGAHERSLIEGPTGAAKKMTTIIGGLQQLAPPEMVEKFNKDGRISVKEIRELNELLKAQKSPAALTDEQMAAAEKAGDAFWTPLGVLSSKREGDVLEGVAKKDNKAQSELGKLKADLNAGLITPELYKAKVAKLTHIAPSGGKDDRRVIDVELKVSDDYRQDARKFAERRPLFDSATDYMANRAKEKTSAGDAALLFAYAKMRDPNDRLAVAETRDLVKLGNIFERFGVSVQGIIEKGETLPDRVARDMYKEIRRSFTEQNRQQLRLESDTERKVKDYGGNPERVVRRFAIPEDQLTQNRREGDKPAEQRKTVGGVNYVKKNGQWYEER